MSPTERTFAITLVLATLYAAQGVAADAAASRPADKHPTAESAVDAFHAALERGDRASALALLLPDVTIFESGEAELSRDEYAAHHLGADMEFVRATREQILVRKVIDGKDQASVWTRSRTTGRFRDKAVDVDGTETVVLQLTPDGWRIAHIHWSSHRRGA